MAANGKGTWVRGDVPQVGAAKFNTSRNKARAAESSAPRPSLSQLFSEPPPPAQPAPAPPQPAPPVQRAPVVVVEVPAKGAVEVEAQPSDSWSIVVARLCEQCALGAASSFDLLVGGIAQDPNTLVQAARPGASLSLATKHVRRVGASRRDSIASGRRASVVLSADSAPSVVFLQVVLPDKKTSLLRCTRDDTLADVKLTAIQAHLKNHPQASQTPSRYVLSFPKEDSAVDPTKPIGSVPYVLQSRSNSMTPSFVLADNPVVSRMAKLAEKELGALIGRPLCWTGGDGEVETCRRVMRSVRRQEHVSSKPNAATAVAKRDEALLGPLERTDFMVNVFLPEVMGGVKKTIKTSTQETGDGLRQRVFDKHYAGVVGEDKTHADYILKIVGFNDFVDGSDMMIEHEFLMKSVYQGEKPLLKMADRLPKPEEPDEDEWGDDEDASSISTIVYDHDLLRRDSVPWDQMVVVSVWDMQQPLRIKVVGIDGVQCRADTKLLAQLKEDGAETLEESNVSFVWTLGVYHGGVLLRESESSRPVQASAYPRWNQYLKFPSLALCNLPRASRLCITLWSVARASGHRVPVGWVNLQLFDYKHELRQGVMSLPLWIDDQANPIGTCVPNSAPGMPIAYFELDRYALPVVFPTEPLTAPGTSADADAGGGAAEAANAELNRVLELAKRDSLYQLSPEECSLIWRHRKQLVLAERGLTKIICATPYDSYLAVQEMHRILEAWKPMGPLDALELLDARYADAHVRAYAVARLETLTDAQLQDYLLQLVQVLKYEPYHDSALARFLVRRALRSSRIGHILFWYLRSEMHVAEITERYGLLLEAYLRGVPNFRKELYKQSYMLGVLEETAKCIKEKDTHADMMDTMVHGLMKLKFPEPLQLPLSPMFQVRSLNIPKCKFMDSKKKPLWLEFTNPDPDGDSIKVIFKEGDDLRQDMLTLQMIRIMDRLWRNHGLDMQMSPYLCMSTGNEVGFIEVVLNADTTAHISKEAGGARAAFQEEPLNNWIKLHNVTPTQYATAQRNFMYSCAGYCVATYVLGIGDRHNDNIMITKSGRLFHIDFGHFLGNYKTKFGIKRERAPFVFTPDFAFVLGGRNSAEFKEFVKLCCDAYNVLRRHSNLFINLFSMMLSTGIPELMQLSDIYYLRDAFSAEMDDAQAAAKFEGLIHESLNCVTTQLNNYTHILAH